MADVELQNTDSHTTYYFFFKDNDEQNILATGLCAILHQLFARWPQLIRHALGVYENNGNTLSKEYLEL